MGRDDILNFIRQHREELKRRFGVVKIGLFGSYAKGVAGDDSDVDIVVEIESENKFRSFFGLKAFLEDSLNKTVDLGIESTLKPAVREQVLQETIYV